MNGSKTHLVLVEAEERVAHAARQVARQESVVAQLQSSGKDAERASRLLSELKRLHELQTAARDRLLDETTQPDLADSSGRSGTTALGP